MCITVTTLRTACPHVDKLCFQTIHRVIHIFTGPITITTIFSFKNKYIYRHLAKFLSYGGK